MSTVLQPLDPWPYTQGRIDDPRLGSIIRPGMEGRVVLVGFPFDEGCIRNGGRAGSKTGPAYVRKFINVMGCVHNVEYDVDLRAVSISDAGDICGATLEEAHDNLQATVTQILRQGSIAFVVGGSNDQSAPNGRALLDVFGRKSAAVMNIDAHLDVRPRIDGKVHSGSPFRELLLGPSERLSNSDVPELLDGRRFWEFASQGAQCSAEHARFVIEQGGKLLWLNEITKHADQPVREFNGFISFIQSTRAAQDPPPAVFISYDIDSISSSDCPGVSCPGNVGLSARDALEICRAAGASPEVKLFDMSELNPVVEDYRSPRLAVLMLYHFLIGVGQRNGQRAAIKAPTGPSPS